jgi:hypothetical protein
LLRQPRRGIPAVAELDPTPYLVDLAASDRTVTLVAPPGAIDGTPLSWPGAPPTLGADEPRW